MDSKLIIVTKKNIEEVNQDGLPPSDDYYTMNEKELFNWLKHNEQFKNAYYRWVESGYKIGFTPAIYFVDDYEGATAKNMKVTIWKYFKKHHLDRGYSYTDLRIMTYYKGDFLQSNNLGLWAAYKELGLMQQGMEANSYYN